MRLNRDMVVALVVVAVVAGGLSLLASTHPDGLEYVAGRLGFEHAAGQVLAAPVPDYTMPGVGSPAAATSLSGLVGAAVVFLVGWGLAGVVARASRSGRRDPRK